MRYFRTVLAMVLLAAPLATAQYNPRALTEPQSSTPIEPADSLENFEAQWPMRIPSPQGQITIYQPQMEELKEDILSARAAVSIASEGKEPAFGVMWFKSRISPDRAARVVVAQDVTITQTRLPDADPTAEQTLRDALSQAITTEPMQLSFDQLLSILETNELPATAPANLATDAPRIIFVEHPAIKVQYDGEPKLLEVVDSPLKRAANTPFFVVLDPASGRYFLKGGGVWYEAPDPLGPFVRAARVPQAAITLADESGYRDPQEPLPAELLDRLEIITATEPTELIWTDGPPQMGTIPGTLLLHATNTPSDVFVSVATQKTYVLISGRWYEAPNRQGPWTFVPPDRLPADFAKIPADGPRGDVLAHVPGTSQAKQAVADTYVPQTATINRRSFEQPAIEYDGEARFEPVEGTSLTYAINSPQPVVAVDRNYYACTNAVWYVSSSPYGPWDLCTDVPDVIYTIPPSCPIYPVRYVYVYDYTPDYVYCGYTPGYLGSYVHGGVVVFGTGYHYRPWWGRHYYPRPYTYGFGARYDPYVYDWGFGFGFSSGGGSFWIGHRERGWHRRPWFGYGGYRSAHVPFDHRFHRFRYDYRNRFDGRDERRAERNRDRDRERRANVFGNERLASDRNVNVYERRSDVRRVQTPRTLETARRSPGQPPRGEPRRNDVVADRDGRVYRRTTEGDWEVRDNGRWRSEGRAPAALANEPIARDQRPPRSTRQALPQENRSTNPGTPRVRPEREPDRAPVVERPSRINPAQREREPEVDRPSPLARQRENDPPAVRENRTSRPTPAPTEDRSTRAPTVRREDRPSPVQPRTSEPQPRIDRSERQNAGGQSRPFRVSPAPREVPQAPSITRSAPRESRSQPRVQSRAPEVRRSRPAPQVYASPRSAPRRETPSRVQSPQPSRSSSRFDSMPGRGGGSVGRRVN